MHSYESIEYDWFDCVTCISLIKILMSNKSTENIFK
jgi:hypothetical protein